MSNDPIKHWNTENCELNTRFKWLRAPTANDWHKYTDIYAFEEATSITFDLNPTGMPDVVITAIHRYLCGVRDGKSLHDYSGDEQALMAAACDLVSRVGKFVEYGASARTAWIEEDGRLWIADYENDAETRSAEKSENHEA